MIWMILNCYLNTHCNAWYSDPWYILHLSFNQLSGISIQGKLHYRLCSCQSTLSSAVEKIENKSYVFHNNLSKSWLTTTQAVCTSPCKEISLIKCTQKQILGLKLKLKFKTWGICFDFISRCSATPERVATKLRWISWVPITIWVYLLIHQKFVG